MKKEKIDKLIVCFRKLGHKNIRDIDFRVPVGNRFLVMREAVCRAALFYLNEEFLLYLNPVSPAGAERALAEALDVKPLNVSALIHIVGFVRKKYRNKVHFTELTVTGHMVATALEHYDWGDNEMESYTAFRRKDEQEEIEYFNT